MPVPVIVAGAAVSGVGASAGTAAVMWRLFPHLRGFVKKVLMPLLGLMVLLPVMLAPFAAVAAQGVFQSFLRPLATSCAQAAESGLTSGGQVIFPLAAGSWTLTSPYGMRIHPITGFAKMHNGTDFGAADGTPILSIMNGTVGDVVFPLSGNNYVTINSVDANGVNVRALYMHMWRDGIFVEPGMTVAAGDVIGTVGNAGTSTGAHLHLEMRVEGDRVDPIPLLASYGALEVADCELLEQ